MEKQRFALEFRKSGKLQVVSFSGFLTNGLTESLLPEIEKNLADGTLKYLFDFSGVTMLESPAVAVLLTVTEKIVDEYNGELSFCNLNEMAGKVLEMVGVFLYAGRYETEAEATADMGD